MTIEQARNAVKYYWNEASDILGLEEAFSVMTNYGNAFAPDVILQDCIYKLQPTSLRMHIYAQAWMIHRTKYGPCTDNNMAARINMEMFCFAMALSLLKGLHIPLIPLYKDIADTKRAILLFIENISGLKGRLVKDSFPNKTKEEFYSFIPNQESQEILIQKQFHTTQRYHIEDIPLGAKGSLENPCDNVHEAAAYIKALEKIAYEGDAQIHYNENAPYYYDPERNCFRVTWASPYVAQMKNEFPEHSFVMSQMDTGVFCLKPNLYKKKFLYRGQTDYFEGRPCVPSMYRDKDHNDKHYYLDFIIFADEMEVMMRSHPMVKLLENGVELLHDKFKIRMNYRGLAQHYYNKSIYLDLTSDIEIAKFFATSDYNSEREECSAHIDTTQKGVLYLYELDFPAAFGQHDGYALKNIGKQVFMRSGLQSGFLLEMAYGTDFKVLPEVRAVYFKHDPKIAKEILEKNHNGEDIYPNELLRQVWRKKLKSRYGEKVVSLEAVRLNVVNNKGETMESIIAKLKERGIRVDNYTPQFTEEDLVPYYNDMANGAWERFCDDIYFNTAEGEFYREELKKVRYQERYKWAFEKGAFTKNS